MTENYSNSAAFSLCVGLCLLLFVSNCTPCLNIGHVTYFWMTGHSPIWRAYEKDPTHDSCITELLANCFSVFCSFYVSFSSSIHLLHSISAPSSKLFVSTLTSLCAAVIIHSAFILLLLSFSALICLRACVMWLGLTFFSWRQTESPEAASWPVS